MSVLEVRDLNVAFQNKQQTLTAVDGIDFDLSPGETVALVGESGCGKSLTAQALMRLLPLNARFGKDSQVRWADTDLLSLTERQMRKFRGKRLGMIFQDPMTSLNPVMTIGQQLAEALGSNNTKKLAKLLVEVEIPEPMRRLKQYPHQLSGGQKQRVVIAIALAGKPDVLIADEPTTALDVTTQAQLLLLLKKIQASRKMILLLITHDLSLVKSFADRVYVMYAGQMVETANVDAFFNQPLHPYTQHLIAALPSFTKRHTQLSAIKGRVPTLDDLPSGCRFHPRCMHWFDKCKKEEPQLLEKNQRQVRCHLYPKHTKPPALTLTQETNQQHAIGEALFQVQHLSVHFPIKQGGVFRPRIVHKAVDDVSFELKQGQTLALVGESGSGKSTVCRVLLKLQAMTLGDVLYQEQSLTTLKGKALKSFRKQVQIVFQDPYSSMNPRMTVGEILAEGMEAQSMPLQEVQKKQLQLLDQVNLPSSSLNRYPHQFSGGQRQRICIARALATSPEVLICDEPTSALDVSVQAQILNLLKTLQNELHLSYLFVTHDMGVVSYIADDVLVMRDGRMVESGRCEDLIKKPKNAYTKALLAGFS